MRWSARDWASLIGLLAATLIVRITCLRTIDLGGDATFKWFFVRSWPFANTWVFDHHTARFSINVWIWMVQRLFGTHPNGMYLPPLLASLAQVPLLYACGRALGVPAAGFLACLLLLLFDPAHDASSQLLPGIFQATYVLAALHGVLRFARAPEQGRRWLWATGIWLFVAYLAMVTSVYVFPGVALGIWCVRRSVRDVAQVFGVFGALWLLETIGYALWSPYPLGQFQLILHTHTDVKPTTFFGLFDRFRALPHDWQGVLLTWLACAGAWLGFFRRRQPQQPGNYALWLVPASALAGITFGIKHLNPIIPATDFSVRYCDVLMPLVALGLGCTAAWLAELAGRRPRPALAAFALVVAAGGAVRQYRPAEPALHVTDQQFRILNDALARNLPIVGANRSEHFQMKTLTCIQWGYIEEQKLLADGELRLFQLGKTRVGSRIHRFLARTELDPELVARAIKSHQCLVTATRLDAEPKLGLSVFDGPDCPRARD
ncbi:MAG TPA: hypothetical protein VJV78_30755 [Polyangiales bacterium]|nr:hypothetical protein [Polyangiales bacterium]